MLYSVLSVLLLVEKCIDSAKLTFYLSVLLSRVEEQEDIKQKKRVGWSAGKEISALVPQLFFSYEGKVLNLNSFVTMP